MNLYNKNDVRNHVDFTYHIRFGTYTNLRNTFTLNLNLLQSCKKGESVNTCSKRKHTKIVINYLNIVKIAKCLNINIVIYSTEARPRKLVKQRHEEDLPPAKCINEDS